MVLVQSPSIHPSSTRSSIISLLFSSFVGRGGGRDVITSYHHCRVRGLLPVILIFLMSSFNMEGNSVADIGGIAISLISICPLRGFNTSHITD